MKKIFLNLIGREKEAFLKSLKNYVYVYCEIDEGNKRVPIYIGKGIGDRCLSHLDYLDKIDSKKNTTIKKLLNEKKLGIDILAHNLDEKTALSIESACIDLMGIDNLTNLHKGHGDHIKRTPLNELSSMMLNKPVKIPYKHRGIAILINRDYKPTFGDLELFEYTRGCWRKNMKTLADDAQYAYATYNGIIKEIYEIHSWVPAGTQEYFSREDLILKDRWEFIGRKAPDDLRKLYIGKLIEKDRAYGNSFVKVGYKKC